MMEAKTMDLKQINEMMNIYLRPQSFPVAIRFVSSADEIPEKAKMPKRDLKVRVALCQGVAMSKRYGWVTAQGADDMVCPAGALTTGFYPPVKEFLDGTFKMPFWGSQEVRVKIAKNIMRLEYGKYKYMITAPLERTTFEPQLILFYGNPAQVVRLIQANLEETGEPLTSTFMGGFACSTEITRTILTDQCQVIVPGGGERSVAWVGDHELCFSIPWSKVDMLMRGLEVTHKAGTRYPVASVLAYEPEMAPGYQQLMEFLRHTKCSE
jgi:uncharacterized protein (DUF169 family)